MRYLIFLLLLSLLFINTSCKTKCKDEASLTKTSNLTPEQKNIVPYNGLDTLRFSSSSGDTAIFYGQGRTTYYKTEYPNDDNCNAPIYKTQWDETNLTSDNYKISIKIISNTLPAFTITVGNKTADYLYFDEPPKYDSILVNGTMYYQVYSQSYIVDLANRIYYTKQKGIIQFSANNKIWYLF